MRYFNLMVLCLFCQSICQGQDTLLHVGKLTVNTTTENVGIGTASPFKTLQVHGDAAQDGIRVTRVGSSAIFEIWSDIQDAGLGTTSAHDFRFVTNNIFRGEISAQGNWGIGTTNPRAKLHVSEGDVYISDAATGVVMKSPDGTCWRLQINNFGSINTTQLIGCP